MAVYTFASFSSRANFAVKNLVLVSALLLQNPPALLTPESVRLPQSTHTAQMPQPPLSSVSRKQRYNTLDFASKIVCQNGLCPFGYPCQGQLRFPFGCLCQHGCSRPYWMTPSQRGFRPLWKLPLFSALLLLLEFVYTNSQKYKKATQPIYEN